MICDWFNLRYQVSDLRTKFMNEYEFSSDLVSADASQGVSRVTQPDMPVPVRHTHSLLPNNSFIHMQGFNKVTWERILAC